MSIERNRSHDVALLTSPGPVPTRPRRRSGRTRLPFHLALAAATLALVLGPDPGAAQAEPGRGSGSAGEAEPGRWALGGGLAVMVPRGEFDDYVDAGFGVAGQATYDVTGGGWLKLRLDGGWTRYGRERVSVPLSRTIGRIRADVVTTNNIGTLALGPELAMPSGPFRPYLHALAGLGFFVTESSVGGRDGLRQEPFARTTNFSDETWSLVAGTGALVPLSGGRHPVDLDVGVQYRANGETRYLREGSIVEEGDGRISLHPIESDTDFLMLRLGVRVRL